jgi:hypothetical protein
MEFDGYRLLRAGCERQGDLLEGRPNQIATVHVSSCPHLESDSLAQTVSALRTSFDDGLEAIRAASKAAHVKMANWCNARSIVVGQRSVLHFSRQARTRPASIFKPDMLIGETQKLFSERIERWAPKIFRKKYVFQVRSDDGRDHFQELSRRFTSSLFLLVYGDPNVDQYGSYIIRQARCRSYSVPDKLKTAVMRKHGAEDIKDDEDDWRFWDASWELMDLAQAHWDGILLEDLSPSFGGGRSRRIAKSSKQCLSTR